MGAEYCMNAQGAGEGKETDGKVDVFLWKMRNRNSAQQPSHLCDLSSSEPRIFLRRLVVQWQRGPQTISFTQGNTVPKSRNWLGMFNSLEEP